MILKALEPHLIGKFNKQGKKGNVEIKLKKYSDFINKTSEWIY